MVDGAGYQNRTGHWTLARFCFTNKLIPHLFVLYTIYVPLATGAPDPIRTDILYSSV